MKFVEEKHSNDMERNRDIKISKIMEYIFSVKGKPLLYAHKSNDCDLYDLEFGELVYRNKNKTETVGSHIFHATCMVKIWWKKRKSTDIRIEENFDGETTTKEFESKMKKLIGLYVKDIQLLEGNILILNLDQFALLLIPYNDEDESWRFFQWKSKEVHVVASSKKIEFE